MYDFINRPLLLAFVLFSLFTSACSTSTGVNNLQSGNSQATYKWNSPSEQITIPFNWHDGHIIIPVSINGSEPVRLALDSGAAVTVLFESERTRNLSLDIERELTINGAGQLANVVNHNVLRVGGMALEDLTILHIPLKNSPIFASVNEAYFDGAIGYDLLSRFQIKIDYINKTISLSRNKTFTTIAPEWQELSINIDTRVPYVDAFLRAGESQAERGSKLLVDTGAPFYLYINPTLQEHLVLPPDNYKSNGVGFNGAYRRLTGRLNELKIGSYSFLKLATHFDMEDFRDLDGVGLLGNGVLKNFDLVFDYQLKKLFIRRHEKFSHKSVLDKSGLDLKPHARGAIVKNVASNSAGDIAQLRAGDVLTDFNESTINSSNYDDFKRLLSVSKDVKLCWIRDASRLCGELTPLTRLSNRE